MTNYYEFYGLRSFIAHIPIKRYSVIILQNYFIFAKPYRVIFFSTQIANSISETKGHGEQ